MSDPTDGHVLPRTPLFIFRGKDLGGDPMREHDGHTCVIVEPCGDEWDAGKFWVRFANGFTGIAFEDELTALGGGSK